MKHQWNYARLLAAVLLCTNLQPDNRAARIAWLSHNAIQINSIDPTIANDDFADLKPLKAAIGNTRIVVLGEQSHGDGATFLAKARLVKFLHERMGFDVLAWEGGLFNCHDMDGAVRDPTVPIDEAMRRGLYPIWAMSAQVRPVFEYARAVAATDRPLEMIGFDHQFSGTGSITRWRDTLIGFIDKVDRTILPDGLRSSLLNDPRNIVFKPDSKAADIRLVAEKWKALPEVFDKARAKLESTHGAREVALMRRTVDDALLSLEGLARFRDAKGEFRPADNNLRDQRMGENLVWLANERYKNRRIIVWAAAFHTLHEPSSIKLGPDASFSYDGVITMGQVAGKALKNAIYTIGFTAAEGKAGTVTGGPTLDLKPPADGSFEDLCLAVGHRFLFVNLRTLPAAHWLRSPVKAGLLNYSPIETDWTRQMDGLVFTRTMFPSTTGPMSPQGVVLTEQSSMRKHRN
ncbi:MAG TPA: erythromycin esterase family protein [Pyrinomonadaceae bacterium]|nr:erythromycin esterase family protein [Pyrinomonadaceae bacterium]